MIQIEYSTHFLRKYKKLDPQFKKEIKMRIKEFCDLKNHQRLDVHKLKADMTPYYAFSINRSDRVAFEFSKDNKIAYLYDVGDHSIYS